ncbi:Putative aliphatic sulfonates transport permease protein SsuC [Planctomyces sp. SH-PL62]|nr:Putative aliphatic sulfonates transport permease protein SsuC [Planctomyces sp. SH-PL62]
MAFGSPAIESVREGAGPSDDVAVEGVGDPGGGPPHLVAALAPPGAALLALLVHLLLPDRQIAPPSRLYAGLLSALLAVSLIMAGLQWTRGRFGAWCRYRGPLAAGGFVLLALWDLATLKRGWLPQPFFPGPNQVLAAMREDAAPLALSTYHSLRLLLSGYAMGVAAGLVCGVLIGWFRAARYWGMPILKVVGPIPATAYVPLAMVMFPNAFLSGAALIALAVWFPVTMLTSSGVANVPMAYLDVARTLGAGRAYLIFRVALPASLPSIFLGLFMGLGSAFLTLIVAETLGVSAGLGWYLKWKQGYLEYAHVYAALAIMAMFFSGLMTALFRIRDSALGWQKGVLRW